MNPNHTDHHNNPIPTVTIDKISSLLSFHQRLHPELHYTAAKELHPEFIKPTTQLAPKHETFQNLLNFFDSIYNGYGKSDYDVIRFIFLHNGWITTHTADKQLLIRDERHLRTVTIPAHQLQTGDLLLHDGNLQEITHVENNTIYYNSRFTDRETQYLEQRQPTQQLPLTPDAMLQIFV